MHGNLPMNKLILVPMVCMYGPSTRCMVAMVDYMVSVTHMKQYKSERDHRGQTYCHKPKEGLYALLNGFTSWN